MARDPSLHKSASFFKRVDNADGLQNALTELHTVHGENKGKNKKPKQGKLPFGLGSKDPQLQEDPQVETQGEIRGQGIDMGDTPEDSLRLTLETARTQEEHLASSGLEETQPNGLDVDSQSQSQSQAAQPTASKLARFRAQHVST